MISFPIQTFAKQISLEHFKTSIINVHVYFLFSERAEAINQLIDLKMNPGAASS